MASNQLDDISRPAVSTTTHLWHPFSQMSEVADRELVIARGEDVWVWDTSGQRYLDACAGLWFTNVGHGRREIRDAIVDQLDRLETYPIFGDLATEPAIALAERLSALAPVPDGRVFLGNGGSDGIDTAAKLARLYWHTLGQPQRTCIVSRAGAYHGTHGYGTSIGGLSANHLGYGPLLPDTVQVAEDSVEAVAEAIERVGADRIAAFFFEPVMGAGGVRPPVDGYIEGVVELCQREGILVVCDSTICGFGRLGDWFGVERWGVVPDMVIFAKGVTSGYLPLGGVVVSGAVAEPFWSPGGPPVRHGGTYAGHATCCAAALANISILADDGLVTAGAELELDLVDALKSLEAHPAVAEVRGGVGFLGAVELDAGVLARNSGAVVRAQGIAREHGVLVRALGTSLAVSPPLTAQPEHLSLTASALAAALDTLANDPGHG